MGKIEIIEQLLAILFPKEKIDRIESLKDENKVSRVFTDSNRYIIKIQEVEGEQFEATFIERMANEIAMYKLLNKLIPEHVARLYHDEVDRGIMIFSDLMTSETVIDDLDHAEQKKRAEISLVEMYKMFARLHGRGMKKEVQQEFQHYQKDVGAKSPLSDSTVDIRQYEQDLLNLLKYLQYDNAAAKDVIAEIRKMEGALFDDTTYHSIIHADSGPHNVLRQPSTADEKDDHYYLIDLEFGSIGPFSQDITGHRLGFPQTWIGKRVPEHHMNALEREYFEELKKNLPEKIEINWEIFQQLLNYSTAHWVVGRMIHLWKSIVEKQINGEEIEFDQDRLNMIALKTHTLIEGASNWPISEVIQQFLQKMSVSLQEILPYAKEDYFAGLA